MIDHTFSATQVSTYELCPRKWAWKYVNGEKAPQNKYAEFGSKTHEHLERWFKERVLPGGESPEEKLARAMIPHLPPPQAVKPENVELEERFVLGSEKYVSKIDLLIEDLDVPEVCDHKTTSDLQWALTPEKMVDDVQATLYAAQVFLRRPNALRVRLRWTYGVRHSCKVSPRVLEVTGRMIQERVSKTIETTRQMRAVLESGARAAEMPYDAHGCEAYGGCAFKSLCNLSTPEKMRSFMSQGSQQQKMDDFLAKLNNQKNGAGAAINPPVAAVAPAQMALPAPAAVPVPSGTNALAAAIAARKAVALPVAPVPVALPVAPAPQPQAASLNTPETMAQEAIYVQETPSPEPPSVVRKPRTPKADIGSQWGEYAKQALGPLITYASGAGLDVSDPTIAIGICDAAEVYADQMLARQLTKHSA